MGSREGTIPIKNWWQFKLRRMGMRARCLCAGDGLKYLGDGLCMTEMTDDERFSIRTELARMLREDAKDYDQTGINYLKNLLCRLKKPVPWYEIALCHMEYFAKNGLMQELRETGEDLECSAVTAEERATIVAGINKIINSGPHTSVLSYLQALHYSLTSSR